MTIHFCETNGTFFLGRLGNMESVLLAFQRQPHKMVNHTEIIRLLTADELF